MPTFSPPAWLKIGLNALIGLVTLSYPLLVWLSLDVFQPRVLAMILVGLFLLRFGMQPSRSQPGLLRLIMPASVLFLLAIAWFNRDEWLLAYPVFVSLAFFVVFFGSLFYPPTLVERLARLEDPDLPPKGVAYTRKVTQVWSVFFLANAGVSLATVCYGDRGLWSLYNGCIFYVLMGLLMAVEMSVRRKVKASY